MLSSLLHLSHLSACLCAEAIKRVGKQGCALVSAACVICQLACAQRQSKERASKSVLLSLLRVSHCQCACGQRIQRVGKQECAFTSADHMCRRACAQRRQSERTGRCRGVLCYQSLPTLSWGCPTCSHCYSASRQATVITTYPCLYHFAL